MHLLSQLREEVETVNKNFTTYASWLCNKKVRKQQGKIKEITRQDLTHISQQRVRQTSRPCGWASNHFDYESPSAPHWTMPQIFPWPCQLLAVCGKGLSMEQLSGSWGMKCWCVVCSMVDFCHPIPSQFPEQQSLHILFLCKTFWIIRYGTSISNLRHMTFVTASKSGEHLEKSCPWLSGACKWKFRSQHFVY